MKKQTAKRWTAKEIAVLKTCDLTNRVQVKQLQTTFNRSRNSILSKYYSLRRSAKANGTQPVTPFRKVITLSNFSNLTINGNSVTITF